MPRHVIFCLPQLLPPQTNAYDADATVWGWSYGLGWATVWIYIVAGVGYYFGYDPEKDED